MDAEEDWNTPSIPSDSAANLHFSDSDEDEAEENTGDYSHYSQQIDDLLDEEENGDKEGNGGRASGSDEDEDEGFVYSGVDAGDLSASYQDQLRDVLDQEDVDESVDDTEQSVEEHEPLVSHYLCVPTIGAN